MIRDETLDERFFVRARARAEKMFLCSVASLAAVLPAVAQTPPGTHVTNVAEVVVPDGKGARRYASNAADTIVLPAFGLRSVRLTVDPGSATVLPGQRISYALRADNESNAPLTGLVVTLPVDADLVDVSAAGGATFATATSAPGTFDPSSAIATWSFPTLEPGESVSVALQATVRPDAPAETPIEMTGAVSANELRSPFPSNTVTSVVMPPLLRVVKTVDRSAAIPGEAVGYTITVTHTQTTPDLPEVLLRDFLPSQLRLVPGSARLDGIPVDDPAIVQGGAELRLAVGPMAPGETRTVRFAARVAATARAGEAINRARADGVTPGGFGAPSNETSAAITVVPGPFRQEAHLVGRVFVDDDGDGVPDPGEPGVPGVLVGLEDGRGAVTDITGRWHLEGIRAGAHVVRLDRATLPETLVPADAGADWGGDRGSRIVVARTAGLAITDMPVGPADAARCRIASGEAVLQIPAASLFDAEGGPARAVDVHLEQAAQWLVDHGGRDSLAATAACPGYEKLQLTLERGLREKIARRSGGVPPPPERVAAPPGRDPLEGVVREAAPSPAILSPASGSRASRSRANVEVVYPAGAIPVLEVAGIRVSNERIGATSTLPSRGVSASRYVGVPLAPGANRLTFRAGDSPPVESIVILPGPVAGLRLSVAEHPWLADGASPGEIRVEAVDAAGMRVAESLLVTVDVDGARPLAIDASPTEEGWQLFLEDGTALLRLAPRSFPGRVLVRAARDDLEAELDVDVSAGGGAWRLVGLAEGRVAGSGGGEGDGGVPPGPDADVAGTGGRVALLARGAVGASSRLTVSLDTARRRDRMRLFGGFEPDRFYPVYGDASTESREVERQGPLYARVDGPRGFAEVGDFATGFERTELARYDRRVSGARGRGAFGKFTLEGFAAPTEQEISRDVFAPDGTSGPYLLSRRPVVARSERVIVEVRDRYRTDEVVSRRVLLADLDYDLDPDAGTILFRGPVAPFDAELRPARVVVLYETHTGGASHTTAGARVVFSADSRVDAGLSLVHEGRDGDDLDLWGLDVAWRPGPGTSVRAEIAGTEDGGSSAIASRVEVGARPNAGLSWNLAWRDLPAGFANPTMLSAPELGSRRLGGGVLWEPSTSWRVKAEAFRQNDLRNEIERSVAGVDAERRWAGVALSAGLGGVASDSAAGRAAAALVRAGVRARLGARWTAELTRRHAFGDEAVPGYPTRTSASLSFDVSPGRTIVLRHETESGDGDTRDRTSLGVESRIGANTKAVARYEMQGGASGAALRASTGIETRVPLTGGRAVSFSAARVDTTRGDDSQDYTTLGAGFERRAGDTLFSSRWEVRLGTSETRHLGTVSGVFPGGRSWTLFARERWFVSSPDGNRRAFRAEGLFGAAWRPVAGRAQALLRLDHALADGIPSTAGGITAGGASSEPGGSVTSPVPAAGSPGLGTDTLRSAQGPDMYTILAALGVRASPRQRLAATLAARFVAAEPGIGADSSLTRMLALHYTGEIRPRWTLGGSVRRFDQRETETATWGAGFEVGYLALRNVWVTGGYNIVGTKEGVVSDLERTERGPFIGFRFKFDERTVDALKDWRLDHGGHEVVGKLEAPDSGPRSESN